MYYWPIKQPNPSPHITSPGEAGDEKNQPFYYPLATMICLTRHSQFHPMDGVSICSHIVESYTIMIINIDHMVGFSPLCCGSNHIIFVVIVKTNMFENLTPSRADSRVTNQTDQLPQLIIKQPMYPIATSSQRTNVK